MNLENPTEEDLKEVERFGAVLFTPMEVECVMQTPGLAKFVEVAGNKMHMAYEKGRLMTIYQVRLNTIEMAKNGSSPAQTAVDKMIKDNEYRAKT